jgi:hypothetical protein
MVAIPKYYLYVLIGLVTVGGLMILFADQVQARKLNQDKLLPKRDETKLVQQKEGDLASIFELFVTTLFDPLYFKCRKARTASVPAGQSGEGETIADLEVEFHFKDTRARFAIKCFYFKKAPMGDAPIFTPEMPYNVDGARQIDFYYVVGMGGSPDDPRELFLIPATVIDEDPIRIDTLARYQKSGMFFYNNAMHRLQ